MSFSLFCKGIENFFPQYKEMASNAWLFEIDISTYDSDSNELIHEVEEELFFLPYQHIILSLPHKVMLLWDESKEQMGLNSKRNFLFFRYLGSQCVFVSGDILSARRRDKNYKLAIELDRKINKYIFTDSHATKILHSDTSSDVIEKLNQNSKHSDPNHNVSVKQKSNAGITLLVQERGYPNPNLFANEVPNTNSYEDRISSFANKLLDATAEEITQFLFMIFYLNTPSRFIVEERPIETSKKSKKIIRRTARSKFIILTPNQIKTRYELNDKSNPVEEDIANKSKSPHMRRRHFRTLKSDRFINKKGEIIIINACWIGTTEFTFEKRKYVVRLDV